MADYFNRPPMTPDAPEETPQPRGGLAPEEHGGLSKFMGDVKKGVHAVMSSPIYARAWSGLVSGIAGDPMAGPQALSFLRQSSLDAQMKQRELDDYGKPTIQDEIAQLRLHDMQRRNKARETVYSDPRNVSDSTMAQAYPDQWAAHQFAAPKAPAQRKLQLPGGKVQQQELMGGQWANVGEPGEPASLVNISTGSSGLDPNQVAIASRAERASFLDAMKPFESFDRARSTLKNVRGMANERGVLPQQASQIIASDVMGALRPEALNEGDVARLTAVGLWNKVNAVLGLPPEMTVAQLDTLAKMVEDKAREAEPKRRAVIEDGRYRATQFGFQPRLILGDYAVDKPAAHQSGPPAGAMPDPNVPGLFVLPDGSGWQAD